MPAKRRWRNAYQSLRSASVSRERRTRARSVVAAKAPSPASRTNVRSAPSPAGGEGFRVRGPLIVSPRKLDDPRSRDALRSPLPLRERGARAQRGRGEGSKIRGSSRDFPCRAVLGILQRHAPADELVSNAIGFREILGLTGLGARGD